MYCVVCHLQHSLTQCFDCQLFGCFGCGCVCGWWVVGLGGVCCLSLFVGACCPWSLVVVFLLCPLSLSLWVAMAVCGWSVFCPLLSLCCPLSFFVVGCRWSFAVWSLSVAFCGWSGLSFGGCGLWMRFCLSVCGLVVVVGGGRFGCGCSRWFVGCCGWLLGCDGGGGWIFGAVARGGRWL